MHFEILSIDQKWCCMGPQKTRPHSKEIGFRVFHPCLYIKSYGANQSLITFYEGKSSYNQPPSWTGFNTIPRGKLTVGPWADVKNGFTWKIIIVLKVRGGHGE